MEDHLYYDKNNTKCPIRSVTTRRALSEATYNSSVYNGEEYNYDYANPDQVNIVKEVSENVNTNNADHNESKFGRKLRRFYTTIDQTLHLSKKILTSKTSDSKIVTKEDDLKVNQNNADEMLFTSNKTPLQNIKELESEGKDNANSNSPSRFENNYVSNPLIQTPVLTANNNNNNGKKMLESTSSLPIYESLDKHEENSPANLNISCLYSSITRLTDDKSKLCNESQEERLNKTNNNSNNDCEIYQSINELNIDQDKDIMNDSKEKIVQ